MEWWANWPFYTIRVCLVSKELHAYFHQTVIASIDDMFFYVGPIACLSSATSQIRSRVAHNRWRVWLVRCQVCTLRCGVWDLAEFNHCHLWPAIKHIFDGWKHFWPALSLTPQNQTPTITPSPNHIPLYLFHFHRIGAKAAKGYTDVLSGIVVWWHRMIHV